MRSYPCNSPDAAARIVALVLIADGHVCRSEIEALHELEIERELGIAAGGFAKVVHTLCEDLLIAADGTGTLMCSVDESTLAWLMAEVQAPALQRTVLRLAHAAVEADRHMADGEATVMRAARKHWRIDEERRPSAAAVSSPQAA